MHDPCRFPIIPRLEVQNPLFRNQGQFRARCPQQLVGRWYVFLHLHRTKVVGIVYRYAVQLARGQLAYQKVVTAGKNNSTQSEAVAQKMGIFDQDFRRPIGRQNSDDRPLAVGDIDGAPIAIHRLWCLHLQGQGNRVRSTAGE